MMAAPHDRSRNLLEEAFWSYNDLYPHERALVRINVHMSKTAEALAAGAVEYRTHLLNSKFCLIAKGHQWSARHLWNAVAGGCVPVLIGAYTTLELPFQSTLRYSDFSARTQYAMCAQHEELIAFLRGLLHDYYLDLRDHLSEARKVLIPGRGNPVVPRGGAGYEASASFGDALQREVELRIPLWEHLLLPAAGES